MREQKTESINACLKNLGLDYQGNIDKIIALCGEMLGADEVVYVRIEGTAVYEVGHWGEKTGAMNQPHTAGSLAYDIITADYQCISWEGDDKVSYGGYGIQSFLAHKITLDNSIIGVLLVNYIHQLHKYSPADEEFLGIMASVIVSEETRRNANLVIYEREEKYRDLVDASHTLLWEIDLKGVVTFVSNSCRQLYGYEPAEIIGKPFSSLMTQESAEKLNNNLTLQYNSLMPDQGQCEVCIVSKNGKTCWIELDGSFLWKWGEVVGRKGIGTDVTERKLRELRLLALKDATQLLLYEPTSYLKYLEILGTTTYLERLGLFLNDPTKKETFSLVDFWRRAGASPPEKQFSEITYQYLASTGWDTKLFKGETVIDTPEVLLNVEFGKIDSSALKDRNIIVVPLFLEESFEGFIVAIGQDLGKEEVAFMQTAALLLGQSILRNRMESLVAKSEEQLRRITDNALDIIFSVDQNGKITFINPAVEKVLGYTREEVLAFPRGIYDLIHPAEGNVAEGLATGAALEWAMPLTARGAHKNNKRNVWLEIQAIKGISSAGEPRIEGIARDVSAKVKTERQLKESERRYRAIIEHSNLLAVMLNSKGEVTYANSLFLDITGYDPEEILGLPYIDRFVLQEKQERFNEVFFSTVKTKICPPVTHGSLPSRKTAPRLIEWNNTILFGSNMEIVGITSVGTDITVRFNAEKLVQESEEKYRTLVENVPVGICRTTPEPEGKFLAANPATAKMLGYSSPEELMTVPVRKLYFNETDRDLFSRRASQGPQSGFDMTLKKKDGSHCYAMGSSSLVKDSAGAVLYFDCVIEDVTEKRKAQDNIRQILDHMRTGIVITGHRSIMPPERRKTPRSNLLFYNWALTEMTGYSDKDFDTISLEDIVHESYHEDIKAILGITSPDEAVLHNYEIKLNHKDGMEVWAQMSPSLIYWGAGTAIVISFTEITNRKVATDRLTILHDMSIAMRQGNVTLSKDTLGNILSLIIRGSRMDSGYVYIIGADGHLHMAAAEGLSRGMLRTDPLSYLTDKEIATPIYFSIDNDLKFKNQEIIKKEGVKAVAVLPVIQGGKIIAVFMTASHSAIEIPSEEKSFLETAITEIGVYLSKEFAEKQLADSEEFYRLLIENANDGIFIISNGLPVYMNHEFAGYTKEDMLSLAPNELVPNDDRSFVLANYDTVLRKRSPVQIRHRITHKKGSILWVNSSLIPIVWHQRPAVLNYMRDISELKKMEDNVFQAEKMNAIGTLAGGMAHDFNNVLMGIQGRAALMLNKTKPSTANYSDLKSIEQLVESGSEITRQLLGFARGGMYDPRPLNMGVFLEKIVKIYSRTKREIAFHQKYDPNTWQVYADKGQIEQVFMNLFVNAAQAMPGGGNLYLETGNLVIKDEKDGLPPGEYVKITVTDDGVGMDDSTKDRIFEPFFTSKEMGRGSGLGLATVYGIIHNHGGHINVHSTRGFGTAFNIYLPATEQSVPAKEKISRKKKAIPTGKETILVVDDEPEVLAVMKLMLKDLGYQVYVAADGKAAVKTYKSHNGSIDMVILDMIMPGYSGEQVFDDIHKINPKVRVLLASGYSVTAQAKKILSKGCLGFIQKPYGPRILAEKVREILAIPLPAAKIKDKTKKPVPKMKPKKTT